MNTGDGCVERKGLRHQARWGLLIGFRLWSWLCLGPRFLVIRSREYPGHRIGELIDTSLEPFRRRIVAVFHESGPFLNDLQDGIVEIQFAFQRLLLSNQRITLALGSGSDLLVDV